MFEAKETCKEICKETVPDIRISFVNDTRRAASNFPQRSFVIWGYLHNETSRLVD